MHRPDPDNPDPDHPDMDCQTLRSHLPALCYDELDEPTAAAASRHLASCPACRAERQALARTLGLLDAWGPVESSFDTRDLAAMAAARATAGSKTRPLNGPGGHGALRRLGPWMGGIAAGIVLSVVAVLVAADLRLVDGGLVAVVGGGAAARDADPDGRLRSSIENVIRDEIARDRQFIFEAIQGRFDEWDREHQQRYMALVEAIDTLRTEDRATFARAIELVAESAAADARRTRDALDGVIHLVALDRGLPYEYRPRTEQERVP